MAGRRRRLRRSSTRRTRLADRRARSRPSSRSPTSASTTSSWWISPALRTWSERSVAWTYACPRRRRIRHLGWTYRPAEAPSTAIRRSPSYRARKGIGDGSDLGRIDRQQAFLASMVQKATSTGVLLNPVRLVGFLDAATKSVTTDPALSSVSALGSLANSLKNISTRRDRLRHRAGRRPRRRSQPDVARRIKPARCSTPYAMTPPCPSRRGSHRRTTSR